MTVSVRALTKRFDGSRHAAVHEVSFEAKESGITALLGPSGSGKSTILRSIAGLEEPEHGQILIDGKDVTSVPARERNVGVVFQSYALFKHLTVADNVGFGLDVRRAPRAERNARVKELLSLVQLDTYAERYPSQLSGGQRQRVALARALATRPGVLLLDEPFGALDTQVRVELRTWLRDLHDKTHVTTLLITHDQEEALELADHVVLLEGGQVAQAGTPYELYEQPASPFVASFLGGANLLSGRMTGGHFTPSGRPGGTPEAEAPLRAFVRPHDLRIKKATAASDGATLGEVERVVRIGGYVKLKLVLTGGESLTVQMRKDEAELDGVGQGDQVAVDFGRVRVFENPSYSI